jgi:hypothetical protein
MKLIYCSNCKEIYRLFNEIRKCSRGCTWGKYIDETNAEYGGESAIPLGFANSSFNEAIANRPQTSPGEPFTAFVIEKECPTMKHITRDSVIERLLKERS